MIDKKISIIIPTYNHFEDCLKPCIESVLKYTDLDDVEIIVVANGCTDQTKEYTERLFDEGVRLLWFDEALGYTKATNEGIKVASGEFVILLSNDTVLLNQQKNQWIKILKEPFLDKKTAVTGPLKSFCPFSQSEFMIFFCVMIKRKIFNEIGLLDESFNPGSGEDIDFCIRCTQKGYQTIQVPLGLESSLDQSKDFISGGFPIYHAAEQTVKDLKNIPPFNTDWEKIFERNGKILSERYGEKEEPKTFGGGGNPVFRKYVKEHILRKFPDKETLILDVGAGEGSYSDLLSEHYKNIDAIEIYEPNISGNKLKNKYRQVFCENIVNFYFDFYDVIIMEDLLEHLSVEEAQFLINRISKRSKEIIVVVPWMYHQGELYSNPHEIHLPPDLIPEVMSERYPTLYPLEINEKGGVYVKRKPKLINGVTVGVSTKNRYDSTLPLCLVSIANQTYKPKMVVIFDDGEHINLLQHPKYQHVYRHIFSLFEKKGIEWRVCWGEKKGQVLNHQKILDLAETKYIWRLDDDNIAESNVLQILVDHMKDEKVGAAAGLVIDPTLNIDPGDKFSYNKIEDIFESQNIQWFNHDGIHEVEHLYSSFLYKKEAATHGYNMHLSPAGHREETMFTYEMHRNGWKLIVDPSVTTHHFRSEQGGIRSYDDKTMWDHDENIFRNKLETWEKHSEKRELVVLKNGIGDHYAFANILREYPEKQKEIILALCYESAFEDFDLKTISIEESKNLCNDIGKFDIYKWMAERRWNKPIKEAFREMYFPKEKSEDFKIEMKKMFNPESKIVVISPFSRMLRDEKGEPNPEKTNPKNYPWWTELVALFQKNDWEVVQVGTEEEKAIGANEILFDLNPDLLKKLIDKSCFWISVDNFMGHYGPYLGRPGIVLWGKSNPNLFGYRDNLNLLKDEKYLRPHAFGIWEDETFEEDAFLKPEEVFKRILTRQDELQNEQ